MFKILTTKAKMHAYVEVCEFPCWICSRMREVGHVTEQKTIEEMYIYPHSLIKKCSIIYKSQSFCSIQTKLIRKMAWLLFSAYVIKPQLLITWHISIIYFSCNTFARLASLLLMWKKNTVFWDILPAYYPSPKLWPCPFDYLLICLETVG